MRIVIYGAGAIGSLIGGYLFETGQEVLLIARKAHVEAIQRDGLVIEGIRGTKRVTVPAATEVAQPKEDDILFITVKSQDLQDAMSDLIRHGWKNKPVFCFQNGVRNEENASRQFANVYGGMIYMGGKFLEPGKITHTSHGVLAIGKYPKGKDELCQRVYEVLKKQFQAHIVDDIMALKWSKLLRNLNNATLAITGLSYEEANSDIEASSFMADVMEEGLTAVKKAGIALLDISGMPTAEESIRTMRQGKNTTAKPSTYPSTWQDLIVGRDKTEVDYFNGEIVRLGEKVRIATPMNSLLQRTVSEMLKEKKKPGEYTISQLQHRNL